MDISWIDGNFPIDVYDYNDFNDISNWSIMVILDFIIFLSLFLYYVN